MTARLFALTLALAVPAAAAAQAPAGPQPRSFEVAAGAVALGPVDFGQATANLIANQSGAPPTTFFRASTSIGTGAGVDGRLAFNVTRALAVEAGFVWTRATMESRITSDVEGFPDVTATQDLDTYFVEASAVWHLNALAFAGRRAVPFVAGGAGYLRQLDDQSLLTDDPGRVYHAGGGLKLALAERRRGFIRGYGIRGDARLYMVEGGVELDESKTRRNRWAVAGHLFVRF